MIFVVYGYERLQHRSLFEQMFSLRREIFVQGRGWSLPEKNGLEIDQYDTDEAVYFIDIDASGRIEAHVRMTPTIRSSLIADYFPHLVEGGVDARSPLIYEATRFMVLPAKRDPAYARAVKAKLFAGLVEWCMDHGHSHLQSVIDAGVLPGYVAISLLTTPLGLAHPFGGGKGVPGGGECLAFRWPIVDRLLQDITSFGGLEPSAGRWWRSMPKQAAA